MTRPIRSSFRCICITEDGGQLPDDGANSNDPHNPRDFACDKNLQHFCTACLAALRLPHLIWLWADTAHVDNILAARSSHPFKSNPWWYQSGDDCLACLGDLDSSSHGGNPIQNHKWLKQCLILFEAVAPGQLQFYDKPLHTCFQVSEGPPKHHIWNHPHGTPSCRISSQPTSVQRSVAGDISTRATWMITGRGVALVARDHLVQYTSYLDVAQHPGYHPSVKLGGSRKEVVTSNPLSILLWIESDPIFPDRVNLTVGKYIQSMSGCEKARIHSHTVRNWQLSNTNKRNDILFGLPHVLCLKHSYRGFETDCGMQILEEAPTGLDHTRVKLTIPVSDNRHTLYLFGSFGFQRHTCSISLFEKLEQLGNQHVEESQQFPDHLSECYSRADYESSEEEFESFYLESPHPILTARDLEPCLNIVLGDIVVTALRNFSNEIIKSSTVAKRTRSSKLSQAPKRMRLQTSIERGQLQQTHCLQEELAVSLESPWSIGRHFACPFYVTNPKQYVQCLALSDATTIQELKQHLWISHARRQYCPRCGLTFDTASTRNEHLKHRNCQLQDLVVPDGLSRDQMQQMFKRPIPGTSEDSQWFEIWKLVMPSQGDGQRLPATPYIADERGFVLCAARDFWNRQGRGIIADIISQWDPMGCKVIDMQRQKDVLLQIILNSLVDRLLVNFDLTDEEQSPGFDDDLTMGLRIAIKRLRHFWSRNG